MSKWIRNYIGYVLLVLTVYPAVSRGAEAQDTAPIQQCDACRQFNDLNTLVRDGKIRKDEARKQISDLIPKIKSFALQHGAGQYPRSTWVFPVAGLNVKTAGNSRGADYVPAGYDYFDGNAHGGHPSFDLFIHDKNQDSLDDRTGKPVAVLSLTGGIVVAAETGWDAHSKLRGGKYIWIYDPSSDALVYYAHNKDISVKVGDILAPGDIIAEVGRTGLNAHRKRSPTHLHITYLTIKDGYPKPENIFGDLKRAISK